MANIINLDAESQANLIGDDAQPTLTLENSSTGHSLELKREDSGIAAANATLGMQLALNPSSVASGAVLKFNANALVSLTSVLATTGGVAGTHGLRVAVGDGVFGWIPVYPDGAVTAAAV